MTNVDCRTWTAGIEELYRHASSYRTPPTEGLSITTALAEVEMGNLARDCEIALGMTEARPETVYQARLRLAYRIGLVKVVRAAKVWKGTTVVIDGLPVRVLKREKWNATHVRITWEDTGAAIPGAYSAEDRVLMSSKMFSLDELLEVR